MAGCFDNKVVKLMTVTIGVTVTSYSNRKMFFSRIAARLSWLVRFKLNKDSREVARFHLNCCLGSEQLG
jgi:hypothetical protein